MLELVVAHYTENLNWLRNIPVNLPKTIYHKGSDTLPEWDYVTLPNIGREAHTYLHHLVTRYATLPDWTIFCQGKPFDHAYDFKKSLHEFVKTPEAISSSGFRWLGHLIDTDDNQGNTLFRGWSKNEDGRHLDLRGFHNVVFGNDGPAQYTFVLGAQFAVHRNVVHQQDVTFYERALAVANTFPDAAHCFERSWDRIFGVTGIDPTWLAGRRTVHLKPMKHQLLPLANSHPAEK